MLSPEEVVEHPQLHARRVSGSAPSGMREYSRDGYAVFCGWRGDASGREAPYRIGEHTREVLEEVLRYRRTGSGL